MIADVSDVGINLMCCFRTESEMGKIELFDTVPDNYTYDKNEETQDIEKIEKMLKAY